MIPTFSVVIPAKNEERYLPAVLKAIQTQTLQPEVVIVADGASTDSTRDIAASYGATVITGGAVAVGRNNGAAIVTSECIFFLDADVIIDDNDFFLHAMEEFAVRQLAVASADVVVHSAHRFDRISASLYNWYVRLWGHRHPHAAGFCTLVRRSVHENISGYNPAVYFAEDNDYGLRVKAAGGKFGVLNSIHIGVTTRRQERDGRLRMTVTYVLAEPYIFLFGPITKNIFRYSFGYQNAKDGEGKNVLH